MTFQVGPTPTEKQLQTSSGTTQAADTVVQDALASTLDSFSETGIEIGHIQAGTYSILLGVLLAILQIVPWFLTWKDAVDYA